MGGNYMKQCLLFLLLECFVYSIDGSKSFDSLKIRESQHVHVQSVCDCTKRLIPEVKAIYEVLWVLSGIVEKAQMNAAVVAEASRKNQTARQSAEPDIRTAQNVEVNQDRSGRYFFNPTIRRDFFYRIRETFPSLDQIRTNVTRLGASRSFDVDEGQCPLSYSIVVYNNLTSQVTDAAIFMSEVESDEDLAVSNLLGIRLMVVEMNNNTEKFSRMLEDLENIPCPDTEEEVPSSPIDTRSFGDKTVECACVNQLLPEARTVTSELDWLLHILRETEGHAIWTISKSTTGRSAPSGGDYIIDRPRVQYFTAEDYQNKDLYRKTVFAVPFGDPAHGTLETTKSPISRSALGLSDNSCPLQDLLEFREKVHTKLTDVAHYREDVNKETYIAKHILKIVSETIVEMDEKLEYYQNFVAELDAKNC